MRHPPRYSPEMQALHDDLDLLLDPNSSPGRSLLLAIQRTLGQYNLIGLYEPRDILSEASMRAWEYVRKHSQGITNPRAWLRATSVNIIKEKSRAFKKQPVVNGADVERESATPQISNEVISDNIQAACQAFASLSKEDQLILTLRCIEGVSWEVVAYHLEKRGYGQLKEATLRKRGQRAMKRLRLAFHEIRPPKEE